MKLFGQPLGLVVLDVDDVIVEGWRSYLLHTTSAARDLGLDCTPVEQYFVEIQLGQRDVIGNIPCFARQMWPGISDAFIEQFVDRTETHSNIHEHPEVNGSVQTIQWLRQRQIPLAICSNAAEPGIRKRLADVGADFDWFVAAHTREIGFCKPDPRAIRHVLDCTNVASEHAVFVGDLPSDMLAARGSGVRFFGVLSGLTTHAKFASHGVPHTHILSRLSELQNLIEE